MREFFGGARPEPFFVKNLETIQGDERDVILISVGCGRDPSGLLALDFGPLGQARGGERRLNALITRARTRLEVFASLTAEDIDLARAQGRGVVLLKEFLHDAATRVLGASAARRGFASPFETAVARAIAGLGYQVEGQIGVAGCFVDLAVRDPERRGATCSASNATAPPTTARSGRVIVTGCVRSCRRTRAGSCIPDLSLDWLRDPRRSCAPGRCGAGGGASPLGGPRREPDAGASFAEQADDAPDQQVLRLRRSPRARPSPAWSALPYREADFPLPDPVAPHRLAPEAMAETVARIVELEGRCTATRSRGPRRQRTTRRRFNNVFERGGVPANCTLFSTFDDYLLRLDILQSQRA